MANNPFFLRHFMGDKPNVPPPSNQSMSNSPDVILNGTTPVANLSELTTQKSYETEPPDTMIVGSKETNYIYVRALNTATENAKARLWLWYAEPEMLLWPQNWMYQKFQVAGVGQNWTDVNALPNQIVVSNAFELVSPEAPRDHYCMIAIAQSPLQREEPEPPFPGYFSNLTKFAQWIQEHPYAAWRNTIDKPGGTTANWSFPTQIKGPLEEESFNIGVQCKGMPVGSKFRFVIPGGATPAGKSWETVDSGEHEIKKANEAVSLLVEWPAGVVASMTITWWANGTTANEGATIEPMIGVGTQALEGLVEDPLKGSQETLLYEKAGDPHTAQVIRQHNVGGMPIRIRG
jgi:hypothetical protein